jgi:hypothetical protein
MTAILYAAFCKNRVPAAIAVIKRTKAKQTVKIIRLFRRVAGKKFAGFMGKERVGPSPPVFKIRVHSAPVFFVKIGLNPRDFHPLKSG